MVKSDSVSEKSSSGQEWTRTSVVFAIRKLTKETGQPPLVSDHVGSSDEMPSYTIVKRLFGSWNTAIEEAGFAELTRHNRAEPWSKPEVIARIRDWSAFYGEPPRSRDWTRAGAKRRSGTGSGPRLEAELQTWPLTSVVIRLFGTWNGAIAAAEMPVRPEGPALTWTRKRILESIREWNREHLTPPRPADWRTVGPDSPWPAAGTVRRCFGSWQAALDQCESEERR